MLTRLQLNFLLTSSNAQDENHDKAKPMFIGDHMKTVRDALWSYSRMKTLDEYPATERRLLCVTVCPKRNDKKARVTLEKGRHIHIYVALCCGQVELSTYAPRKT